MEPLPRALVRTAGNIVTAAGDIFVVTAGKEEVPALRQALDDGFGTIALSGCRTAADLQRLAVLLSVAEAESDRPDGSTPILAVTDGILSPPLSSPRLVGLVWDADLLAATLGATPRRTAEGEWTGAFAAARAAVLLSAAAVGLPACDTASPLEGEAFAADCRRSRDDGFCGRLADDPRQAETIESIYGAGRSISKTSEASQ